MEEKNMSIDEAVAAIKCVKADESITIVLAENTTQITIALNRALARGEDCCKVNLDLSKTKITEIGEGAFLCCTSLTSVTIPDGVTSIGDCAFRDCLSLTGVTIPDSVTSIGVGAFEGCSSLTSVIIPDSVTSIGWDAFNGCTSLASVTIPNGVTGIRNDAFEYNVTVTYKGKTDTWANIYRQFFAKQFE